MSQIKNAGTAIISLNTRAKEKELEYVWVCKRCLRVTRDTGSVHAKEPNRPDWCKGEFIKKPVW